MHPFRPSPLTFKSRILALPFHIPQTMEVSLRYLLEKPTDWENLGSEEAIAEKILYPGIDVEE